MVGRAASLLGPKISELEKEVPRLMLAGGAGPAPHSPGAQEGREVLSPALLAGGEKGFCLCMGKVLQLVPQLIGVFTDC